MALKCPLLIVPFLFSFLSTYALENDVLVFTVATNETHGYNRYIDSVRTFGIEPKILGFGQKWKGGDMLYPGGGWKINLLKNALKPFEGSEEKIVVFTDSYDVIFLGQLSEIIRRFKDTGARVLFGAEPFCWPNVELAPQYPEVTKGQRFLNSGAYIGYLKEINNILNRAEIKDTEDDQLFFTKAYLDKDFRESNKIQLDHLSEIIHNLHGASDILEIKTVEHKEGPETYYLKNRETGTEPLIVHGNGRSKVTLNYLSNYLPNGVWNSIDGCVSCKKGQLDLEKIKRDEWPTVLLALFVEMNTPFLEGFFKKIHQLEYPKNRIHLFVHNAMKYHTNQVNRFIEAHGAEYLSVKQIKPEDGTTEWAARDLSLDQCLAKNCEIYFAVDSIAHLDNQFTLKLLIEQNRTVIAPMLVRPGKAWSNFWGSLTKDGFYARSNDYMDIVHNDKRGLWNVPYINSAYVINSTLLKTYDRSQLSYNKPTVDADMAICQTLRDLDVFMYVSNRVDFGHLINADSYDITRTEPDMYQIFENEQDWEEAYIHPDYPEELNPQHKNEQPCPDVYRFPIVTRKFAQSLINMMESFGKWSSGKNEDERLEGGYEAVPTRDIHMNQVGWERHWLYFLQKYVRPLQEHVFTGYYHDPPRSLMNFVVRYRPDEQPSLRPHHDSSTYTINIALNEAGKDYSGGGCRFIRYNCSVTDSKVGWMLMHPGRLTHYHEGLLVTNGTRYIMISFVDP
ncbi:procollagen-lysine,2-oxoglutarate 5-dioxygenase isoform X2 [Anthonomus grandis grandis]|uniref:procollagen-lysine,2-oxoglutarate 5-dioxygenase isoform X2 n=1 Tax=Anthonomus grandis grandis TaxID=2921223 RepID=UPI00216695F5|nr:procollagen-lysine,2-oxoglutarate 5-dioxygenase isoform X2 [Anthonomus grandis grandis]